MSKVLTSVLPFTLTANEAVDLGDVFSKVTTVITVTGTTDQNTFTMSGSLDNETWYDIGGGNHQLTGAGTLVLGNSNDQLLFEFIKVNFSLGTGTAIVTAAAKLWLFPDS